MKKHICVVCKKKNAILALENDQWICENCAQIMTELADD